MEMVADLEEGEKDSNAFFTVPFYGSDLGDNYRSSDFNFSSIKWR